VERLTQRVATAREALSTLDELAHKPERSKVERDAAIQRFEYTFEAVWKAVQRGASFQSVASSTQPSAWPRDRLTSIWREDLNAPARLLSCFFVTVCRLSRLTTEADGRPSDRPTTTSCGIPRMVVVISATST